MTCTKCKIDKEETSFYKIKSGKRIGKFDPWCKQCKSTYYQSRKEAHYLVARKSSLKRYYGITIEQYDEMCAKQGGVCAICKLPGHTNSRQKYPLYVDHNHMTGKARQLLCASCNTLLGHVENNYSIIEAMKQYLAEHS